MFSDPFDVLPLMFSSHLPPTRNFFGYGETLSPPIFSGKISRGTLDIDNVKHYIWEGPCGQKFDLLLDARKDGQRLIINSGHLMPQSGTFDAARGTLGRPGLRQLSIDLGDQFGIDVIDIPNRINRTTGRTGGFGPISIPLR